MHDTTPETDKPLAIETRSDMQMVRRALKQGWPMTKARRDATIQALCAKISEGPVGVPTRTFRAYHLTLRAFSERDSAEKTEAIRQIDESLPPQRSTP